MDWLELGICKISETLTYSFCIANGFHFRYIHMTCMHGIAYNLPFSRYVALIIALSSSYERTIRWQE